MVAFGARFGVYLTLNLFLKYLPETTPMFFSDITQMYWCGFGYLWQSVSMKNAITLERLPFEQ